MSDAANIMLGPVVLFNGTGGATPTNPLGYTTEDGTEFFPEDEALLVKVGERLGVVKQFAIDCKGTLSTSLLEMTMANLRAVMPAATQTDANTLERLVANTSMRTQSIRAQGLNALGNVRTYDLPYAVGKLKSGIKLSAKDLCMLEAEFGGLALGSSLWKINDGDASNVKTLSSGAFARVAGQAYYRMAGEGAAADALSNITASSGSLVDGEILILQIYSESQPITVTHAADTIELDGEVDWVMNKAGDTLWLQYSTTGTKWVEYARKNSE